MTDDSQWVRYQGHYYQCWERNGSHAFISYPGYVHPGWVNVAPNGRPLLLPAVLWAPLAQVTFMNDEPRVPALPPIPSSAGYAVGARCEWGSSLAEWVIVSLVGSTARIRQVRGWAKAVEFSAPVNELVLLNQPVIEPAREVVEAIAA